MSEPPLIETNLRLLVHQLVFLLKFDAKMLRLITDNLHDFFDWLVELKGGLDDAEVVRAQLLQIEKVLNHERQKALTRTVHVQRVRKFAVNAFQPLFKAARMEIVRTDHLYEVIDLAHLHIHGNNLRVDRIQRIARVVRGCRVDCGHENLLFLLLLHMDSGGLVINL